MRVGDLIFDFAYGMSGVVLEIMDECKALSNLPVNEHYYVVMYDNGTIEAVRDIEVEPIEDVE